MKKTLKIVAVFAAEVMAMGFVSCSNDDAEDLGTLLIVKDYQEKKKSEAAASSPSSDVSEDNTSISNSDEVNSNSVESETMESTPSATTTTDIWILKELKTIGSTTLTTTLTELSADVALAGESGNLVLTCSSVGTGIGTTKGTPSYKYNDLGLVINQDAFKISNVKGKVKLTVVWGKTTCVGGSLTNNTYKKLADEYKKKAQAALDAGEYDLAVEYAQKAEENDALSEAFKKKMLSSDRNLEVTVGDNGNTVETAINARSKAQHDYVVTFDGGTSGTNIYIGASDELYFDTIKIEAVD